MNKKKVVPYQEEKLIIAAAVMLNMKVMVMKIKYFKSRNTLIKLKYI